MSGTILDLTLNVSTHTYTYIIIHIYTNTHIRTHAHTHTRTHTHTHTHTAGSKVYVASHHPYNSYSPQGGDPELWIEFCTDHEDMSITCTWKYFDHPIFWPHNADSYSYQPIPTVSCRNCSLELYNVTFDGADGQYTVTAESSYGFQESQLFDLAVNGCLCGSGAPPPEAYAIQDSLIAAPAPDIPSDFMFQNTWDIVFRGCPDLEHFDIYVGLTEHPSQPESYLCKNGISYDRHFKCRRENKICRIIEQFNLTYTIHSGKQYCAQAVSKDSVGNNGNAICFQFGKYEHVSTYH